MRRFPTATGRARPRRRGAGSVDYVLILGIILPIAAFLIPASKRIVALVYEMIVVFVAWPFM